MSYNVKCSIHGCLTLASTKGMCELHYKRVQRYGDPEYNARPKLVPGQSNKTHPLYHKWRSYSRRDAGRSICPEWKSSFSQFVSDVRDQPSTQHQLRRLDALKPISKDNYYWAAPLGSPEEKKAKMRQKMRDSKMANPTLSQRRSLMKNYGITLECYDQMLEDQNHSCKICGFMELGDGKRLHVDHDHGTGDIRGLLCHHCNTGLGLFKDSQELLQKAIDYLRISMDEVQV